MERAAAEAAHMSAPDHEPHRSRRFLLLPKGRPHMSQSLTMAVDWAWQGRMSHRPYEGSPASEPSQSAHFRPLLHGNAQRLGGWRREQYDRSGRLPAGDRGWGGSYVW